MTLIPTGSRPATRVGAPTILAVADSSERVGLTVTMLDRLSGAGTTVGLAVARTDRTPSPARIRDETEGSRQAGLRVPVLTARQVRSLVRRHRPDVVLLNCSGPLVETLPNAIVSNADCTSGVRINISLVPWAPGIRPTPISGRPI